jgi:hypothetical protein
MAVVQVGSGSAGVYCFPDSSVWPFYFMLSFRTKVLHLLRGVFFVLFLFVWDFNLCLILFIQPLKN